MCKHFLLKIWNYCNPHIIRPLIIIGIVFLGSWLLYSNFVKTEKVDCIFDLKLNYEEVFKADWDNSTVKYVTKLLINDYTFNMTFESYQEASAFERIAFEEIKRSSTSKFYNFHFWCDIDKTIEPSNLNDFLRSGVLI